MELLKKLNRDISGRWLNEESRVGDKLMLSLNIPNFPDDAIQFGAQLVTITRIEDGYPYRIFVTDSNGSEGCLHYSWCRWNVSFEEEMFIVSKMVRVGRPQNSNLIRRIKQCKSQIR